MSLTPHLRQLQALVAAQALPTTLVRELLHPQPPPALAGGGGAAATAASVGAEARGSMAGGVELAGLPGGLRDTLLQRFNPSQQAAIAAAVAGFQAADAVPRVSANGKSTAGAGGATGGTAAATTGPAGASLAGAVVPSRGPCFTLIQGPPGTGKTAAIIGMLSALLVRNAEAGRGPGGRAQRGHGGSSDGEKPRGSKEGSEAARDTVVNPIIR